MLSFVCQENALSNHTCVGLIKYSYHEKDRKGTLL